MIIAILASCLLILLFCIATFLIVIRITKRKQQILFEKEEQAAQFQQQILEARLEMQEHTFRIISQEIHDNVGQILSLTKMNLNIITAQKKQSDEILRVKELVSEAISELRDLSQGYFAEKLARNGLIPAIKKLVDQHERTGLFKTNFYSDFVSVDVDKNHVIFIYRMIQEALNNIVKHASATQVSINVRKKGDKVNILIEDNGKGFDISNSDFNPGIGLSSIRQRASIIGAEAGIRSAPGSGTTIDLLF